MLIHGASGGSPRVVLAPGDPRDAFELTVLATNLVERFQGPISLALDQIVAPDPGPAEGLAGGGPPRRGPQGSPALARSGGRDRARVPLPARVRRRAQRDRPVRARARQRRHTRRAPGERAALRRRPVPPGRARGPDPRAGGGMTASPHGERLPRAYQP